MLYWKYSPTRTFFLNEYWIFIPSAIIVEYLIIARIRSNKAKLKHLKKLKKQLERAEKLKKIMLLALGVSGATNLYLLQRAGSIEEIFDFDTGYLRERCTIEEGVRYLDDNRLRNIIHNLHKNKVKGRIIYITATALCHIANTYGKTFLALPFAIGDFGVTSGIQVVRKLSVTTLFTLVVPFYMAGGPVGMALALVAGVSGLRLANIDLDYIPTSSIPLGTEVPEPRIPGLPDVVVVNNRNRDKITMSLPDPDKNSKECWLADQQLLNSKCQPTPSEIPVDVNLPNYQDTVNMQDVTGLDRAQFTDRYDLEGTPKIKVD